MLCGHVGRLAEGAPAYPAIEVLDRPLIHVARHLVHSLEVKHRHEAPIHHQFIGAGLLFDLECFACDRITLLVADELRHDRLRFATVEMHIDVGLRTIALYIPAGNLPDITAELLIH
ncbi:hypothetical protein WI99_25075 [Burkholderia cepacia]|nr:hypothetical protein WI99_25075 [Burkholderia cepacia]